MEHYRNIGFMAPEAVISCHYATSGEYSRTFQQSYVLYLSHHACIVVVPVAITVPYCCYYSTVEHLQYYKLHTFGSN